MRLRPLIAIAPVLLAFACDQEPTTAPADAAPDAPDPAASEEAEAAAEPTDEEKAEAARQKREEEIAKAIEELEAQATARAKDWTPELEANVKAIADKAYKKTGKALDAILASKHRSPENSARDAHRHPKETLTFFGIKPTSVVVEAGSGGGWYTEILAPLLAKQGKLRVMSFDANGPKDEWTTFMGKRMELMLGQSEALYGAVEVVIQTIEEDAPNLTFGEAGTADFVLVTREMHNWYRGENWDVWMKAVTEALKPGGVLAVVQHRASAGADPNESAKNGGALSNTYQKI